MESLPLPSVELEVVNEPAANADVLVVGLPASGDLSVTMQQLDASSNGWLARCVRHPSVSGEAGELSLVANPSEAGPSMVLVIGLGGESQRSRSDAFRAASIAIRRINERSQSRVDVALAECFPTDCHDAIVSGVLFACEGQGIYQSAPSLHVPDTIGLVGIEDTAVVRGQVIGDSINQTRRLINEPASVIFPDSFAARASDVATDAGLEIEIWDEARLAAEGCRAILAVGGGSVKPPRMVILRHQGGGEEPPLVLVGKGVTFDSGGLSIKPNDGMVDMKCDMSGAATVLGVMQGIARLGVRKNVIGLCGLAENMLSGTSYKVGDVIETRSGKTIEILNTDAEGRVVLADVLDVAVQHRPAAIVDLATLTGACMIALGTEVAGLMTNQDALCAAVEQAAGQEGEPVWQLPMFELYDELIKSKVADIKNVGEGRWAGAITAAKFLECFVGDVPWVHCDIAGPAFADSPKPHRDAGATGVLVRSLIRWIESAPVES